MVGTLNWTARNPGVELRLNPEGASSKNPGAPEPTPRFTLESGPRDGRGNDSLFTPSQAATDDLSLPAAVLPCIGRKEGRNRQHALRAEVEAAIQQAIGETSGAMRPVRLIVPPAEYESLLGLEEGTSTRDPEVPALWVQGLEMSEVRRIQRETGVVPGVFIREDEEVVSLGHAFRNRQFLVPRPRIVLEPQNLVADNAGSRVSMGSLLDDFVQQFAGPENALPNVQIATGYLYGRGLRRVLGILENERVESLQLLFSGKTDRSTAQGLTAMFAEQFDANLGQSSTDRDHAFWERCRRAVQSGRLRLRVYTRAFLHAKLFLAWDHKNSFGNLMSSFAVVGSSNVSGAGFHDHGNLELNITSEDARRNTLLRKWFDARWDEANEPEPPLLDVLEQREPAPEPEFRTDGLQTVWRVGKSGRLKRADEHLQLLAELYRSRLESFSVSDIPAFPEEDALEERTREIDPSPEQRDGVRALASRLLQVRIAFLADSVGLGKTITSLGAAWYLDRLDRVDRVAVVGPRKLFQQWRDDARKIGMPLELVDFVNRHRLERMEPGDAAERLAGADLVIVEEAHEALRNRSNFLWKHLRVHLGEQLGCKLLLVSATPWNNSREDIYNYLHLAWADGRLLTDHYPGLAEEPLRSYLNLFGVHSTSATAGARAFDDLSLERYRDIFGESFLQRTRRTVERDYGREMPFPERQVHPLTTPPSEPHDAFYEKLESALEAANLPYYQAFDALQGAAAAAIGSEKGIEPPSKSGLFGSYVIQRFKRAESSFFALAVSLRSILRSLRDFQDGLHDVLEAEEPREALGHWLDRQYLRPESYDRGGQPVRDWHELTSEELSPDEKVRLADIRSLLDSLGDAAAVRQSVEYLDFELVQADIDRFEALMAELEPQLEREDPKQVRLVDVVDQHYASGHKPIAVAEFADTATRFFLRLVEHLPQARIALALGGGEAWLYRPGVHEHASLGDSEWQRAVEAKDGAARRRLLLGDADRAGRMERRHVLAAFAPEAKNASNEVLRALGGPIDILVGSEAISVGQNLQDSTALVQLDLPWNPMVIEQRIGRIDRRGGGRPAEDEDVARPSRSEADVARPSRSEDRGRDALATKRIVDIYYCWSAAAIEKEVALRERLRRKAGRAMEDTNFDEILLFELKERLETIRRKRDRLPESGRQAELATFLDERQRELVDERTRVEGTDEHTGSEVDGMRRLAVWAEREGIDRDYLPDPVVAAGLGRDAAFRWLVSLRLTPLGPGGKALGEGFLAHVPVSVNAEKSSELASDLDLIARQLEGDGRHATRSGFTQRQWTREVDGLDELLQDYADARLEAHNERAKERLREKMKPASKASASQKLKELAQRARDALKKEMVALKKQESGQQRLAELKDRLAFLYQDALNPQDVYRLLNDTNEAELKRALYAVADDPRDFLGDDFDVLFDRICGGRWERHQQGGEQATLQMPEVDGTWAGLDVEVVGATYIVPPETVDL